MKFGFRHADKFVGLFILVAIVFVVVSLVMTSINKRWFARDYEYFTRFSSADGISIGMPLKLRGFEIGEIRRFTLNDQNKVDVTLVIYDTFIDKVTVDSVIELASNPIGLGGGLNFYPGIQREDLLEEFSYIPSTDSKEGKTLVEEGLVDKGGDDAIAAIMANAEPILAAVTGIMNNLESISGQLDSALAGNQSGPVAGILANLEGTTAGIKDVVPALENILLEVGKVTASVAVLSGELEDPTGLVPRLLNAEGTLDTLFNDNDEIYSYITAILGEILANLENLSSMTGDLKGLTPELNVVLDEATGAISEGKKVLEGLSNNPILKKGISEEVPAAYQHGTMRDEEF